MSYCNIKQYYPQKYERIFGELKIKLAKIFYTHRAKLEVHGQTFYPLCVPQNINIIIFCTKSNGLKRNTILKF